MVLGTLGAIAASWYRDPGSPVGTYPYPAVIPAPPRVHLWCPAAQAYYPTIVACPDAWVRVEVPY